MKKIFVLIFVSFLDLFADHYGYLCNSSSNTVAILDIQENEVIGYVSNGSFDISHPVNLRSSPDETKVYVVSDAVNSVFVIDPALGAVVAKINTNGFPFAAPNGIAVTPDGSKAYVTNEAGANVSVINLTTNMVTGYVDNNSFLLDTPIAVDITPDGAKAYVVCYNGNNVAVIDVMTDTVTGFVNSGMNPFSRPVSIEFISNTKGYVLNQLSSSVSILNVATNTATGYVSAGLFPFSAPYASYATMDLTKMLVTNVGNDKVSVVNLLTDTVSGYVSGTFINPRGVHMRTHHADDFAYVSETSVNQVGVIDMSTLTKIGSVDTSNYSLFGPTVFDLSGIFIQPTPQPATNLGKAITQNRFPSQVDYIHTLFWTPPLGSTVPSSYRVYSDAELSNLIATVPNSDHMELVLHNRIAGASYTYYIVSVTAAGLTSDPAIIQVP